MSSYDVAFRLEKLARQLSRIEAHLITLNDKEKHLMALAQDIQAKIDEASAAINRQTSVEDSNRELLQRLVGMVNDLKNKTTDGAVLQAIDDIVRGINSNTDQLVSDVTANTPADQSGTGQAWNPGTPAQGGEQPPEPNQPEQPSQPDQSTGEGTAGQPVS